MYRVIIIDDEPIITQGLSRTIDWAKYDCQVVATAYDGTEGTKSIRKFHPHILISDIAMPELDGLSMVAGLKSEFPNMEISILTGYRVFDYAQKAINLGVTRFLLKPSNMAELEEAIITMVNNLKAKNIMPGDPWESEDEIIPESTASSFIVKNALQYIKNNYSKKLTLSEVAEKTYVSQWHLSKLLNQHLGKNFSEILNEIRIKEAVKLFEDPHLRICDIAEKVGYVDMAHFSRMCKKILGVSATEYRNMMSAKELNKLMS